MAIDSIRTSGGIFTHHFVESLQQDTLSHTAVRPESFTLPGHDRVTEAAFEKTIANAWTSLVERWDMVEREFGTLDISALRQRWLRPLFYHLNIETEYQRGDTVLEGDLRFPLSHLGRAGTTEFTLPVHSVLYGVEASLETRVGSGRGIKTLAPHDMLQRYLNLSKEHDWAIVTDGVNLRLLRDFHHIYTRGYVEFDLQGIFSTRDFAGFRAMVRLLHASRFIVPEGKEEAPIEKLYQDSLAMGVKVGEDLRKNVQAAIESLAKGFLTSSPGFLDQIRQTEDGAAQLYRDVLMTIYRMLFLLFAEQRGMLPGRGTLYMQEYSLTSLRTLAEQPLGDDRNIDLWERMKTTISMVENGVEELGIYAYNGALFSLERTPLLTPQDISNVPSCRNDDFLVTVKHLTTVEKDKVLQRISYADLSVEEIGSIYESLLEFTPQISDTNLEIEGREIQANAFFLDPRGSGRKTTGSYYTPPSLVNELIKSALVPVMEDRLRSVVSGYDSEYVEALNADERQAAEQALLEIKVVDPAAGSGAFLIAANNKLALELARIRTGDLFPTDTEIRNARRDVLAHCIYAVDLNPMAVELCKVSLWINAAVEDAPLNFLDHHIKCGNSLVGATPELIAEGIPNEAYKPVTGDDKEFAKAIKAQNREERKGQMSLVKVTLLETKEDIKKWQEIDRLAETDPNQAETEYLAYWGSKEYWDKRLPYDLWTSAFFAPMNKGLPVATTQDVKQANISTKGVASETKDHAQTLARQYRFFHWHLEFPQVFDESGKGGFDVVLGNPPWERVKLVEKEFFNGKNVAIFNAPNAAARKRLIKTLSNSNQSLYKDYLEALNVSETTSNFLRNSRSFPLTGRGDINLYQVFAGKARGLISDIGQVGIIVPTGISTDNTNKHFFGDLVGTNQLVSLYDFENRKGIFPEVHRSFKFCLLTLRGKMLGDQSAFASFAFFLLNPDELQDNEKAFKLATSDFQLLNPNTLTCPIFRTRIDASLTRKLYLATPVLINEVSGNNPWGVNFSRMFDMTNDSQLFQTKDELNRKGLSSDGHIFFDANDVWLPLYEAKMIEQYDHRFAGIIHYSERARTGEPQETDIHQHLDPEYFPSFRYWINSNEVKNKSGGLNHSGFIAYKDITTASSERTFKVTWLPYSGVGNSSPIIQPRSSIGLVLQSCLVANFNSFVVDYISRQKIGYLHINFFILKQFPILTPSCFNDRIQNYILQRVFELTYTAWDLKALADDIWRNCSETMRELIKTQWELNTIETENKNIKTLPPEWLYHVHLGMQDTVFPHPPFKWDEERRLLIRCEIDSLYGHLYGLTRDELDYILESFPIVKRKDEEKYGEYRTKRVILENFDKLVDDPMLEDVCVPLNERVSVLEHPDKPQPQAPKVTSLARSVREDKPTYTIRNSKLIAPRPTVKVKESKAKAAPENQQTLFDASTDFSAAQSDFGLYKCQQCSKFVMGFSLDEHTAEVHGGIDPSYEKLK